jgi:hypothetical protein
MGSRKRGICNLIAKLIIAISKISLHSYVMLHQQNLCESLFVGVFLFAELNSCANVTVTKNQDTRRRVRIAKEMIHNTPHNLFE